MAGACAPDVNGRPKAAADKREIRSLFMDSKVLKTNSNIVSPESVKNLTPQTHRPIHVRVVAQL